MKKFFTLLAVAMMATASAWADVTYPANHTPFTISNPNVTGCDGRGYLVVYNNELYLTDMKASYNNFSFSGYPTTHTEDNANDEWALYTSPVTGNHYLYNVSSGKFLGVGIKLGGTNAAATLEEEAKAVTFTDASYSGTTYVSIKTSESLPSGLNASNNVLNFAPYWGHDEKAKGGTYGCWDVAKNTDNSETRAKIETTSGSVSDDVKTKVETAVTAAEATFISALQDKIDALYGMGSNINTLGYPKYTAASVTTLMSYFSGMGNGVTVTNYTAALEAYNAVLAETDIVLPEDGKAYKIWNVMSNGDKRAVYYDGSTMKTGTTMNPSSATDGDVFICHYLSGNDFVFVAPSNGKYMHLVADSKNQAFEESYSEQFCKLEITKFPKNNGNGRDNLSAATLENTFGILRIKGVIETSGTTKHYLMGTTDGKFANDEAGCLYFTAAAQSSGFAFEEVENPNKVVLTKPASTFEGGLNGKYVGTFSAPYAVELPQGVVAYTAEINDAKTVVTFNAIDGNVVPKNTGVLVYAENAETTINANAVPAATATLPSVGTDNIFEPMVSGSIDADNLVLGFTAEEGVMFYPLAEAKAVSNKAYIPASVASSNLNAFRFDFEDTVTGIEAIESNTVETVFDLQGRRVQGAMSGLYIVNGKKVIR